MFQRKKQWIDRDESPHPNRNVHDSWKKIKAVFIVGSLRYNSFFESFNCNIVEDFTRNICNVCIKIF